MTNYWYWKRRRKMPEVNALEKLPHGHWLPVKKAAQELRLTPMAVRYRYLRGALRVAKVRGRIYVDVSSEGGMK